MKQQINHTIETTRDSEIRDKDIKQEFKNVHKIMPAYFLSLKHCFEKQQQFMKQHFTFID
jgi:hypothetical protein